MSLAGKNIWIDLEEPKAPIQFKFLFPALENAGANLLITARDFDSTFNILDEIGITYVPAGRHGGASLLGKLESYIERLSLLLPLVKEFKPDYLITFGSSEALRIAFGLKIPSIGFNDEPRSVAVGKLMLPFIDKVITPKCVPEHLYLELGATKDKLIRYNGIDEIGWLSHFTPDEADIKNLGVEKGRYVIIRSEMSTAEYLLETIKPEESMIPEFLPDIMNHFPDLHYFVIGRTNEQRAWLESKLHPANHENVTITGFIPNIANACFFSALVISGGGTIVRESSLLGVPSIEFFPGDTAPQEHFLMDNKFPIWHIKDPTAISRKAIKILKREPSNTRFTHAFKNKIAQFDNPTRILLEHVTADLKP
ncbi:MAG: DUF354 domain-containing protein [Promethearchaeota archaeon]